jgi:hypothetical protein
LELQMMRAGLALAILIGTTLTALADSGPVIVIPGRPGLPVIINGVDASWAVVEGDWGLAKGVHVQPTVYGGRVLEAEPPVGHYYPSSGHLPGYGRLEILPRDNGKPAESYHQTWSAQSAPQPVAPQAQPDIPFYPPPVIIAPQNGMPRDPGYPPQDPRRRERPPLPQ